MRYDEKKNRDCFGLKLKFYPDEILEILTNENNSVAATQAQFSGEDAAWLKLSARTLKSVKTQAMGIIRSWVQQILQSYQFGYFNRDQYKKSHRKNIRKYCDDKRKVVKKLISSRQLAKLDKFEFNSINCQLLRAEVDNKQFDLSENSDFDLLFCLNSMYSKSYKEQKGIKNNHLYIPLCSHHHFNELKSGVVANVQCKLIEIGKAFSSVKKELKSDSSLNHLPKKLSSKTKSLASIRGKENCLLQSLLHLKQLQQTKMKLLVTLMKRHLKKQI